MNQTLINENETTSSMACLLDRFPQALRWGLPSFLRESDAEHCDWRESAARGDFSAGVVQYALKEAYQIAGNSRQGLEVPDSVGELADFAETVLENQQIDNSPWNVLIAAVEIPAVLSEHFSDIPVVRRLLGSAAACLNDSAIKLFDEQGIIKARHFPWYAAILATWTRCYAAVGRKQLNLKLKKRFVNTYEWAVRQLLIFSNGNRGITSLSESHDIELPKDFISQLLKFGGDVSDRRLASRLGYAQREFNKAVVDHYLPEATAHSSSSQVAVLRTGWGPKRREVFVRFDKYDVFVQIRSCGTTLFEGNIASSLWVEGNEANPLGAWEEVCWESDEDADYLELELGYAGGWKVQKQILLAKDDNLLLIGDAVIGKGEQTCVALQHRYECGENIRMFTAEDHNEGFVWSSDPVGMVMPLALPEWRNGTRNGHLTCDDGVMHYEVKADGVTGLYAPLLLVLHGKAGLKKYTWRQLTIAEELDVQPSDVASGYRIQIGKKQWLIYRSLTEYGNRTLLGQNYSSEFAFGEFLEDGTVYEYVEIE